MSGSDDDEIVFVRETRDGSALEGCAKRVRYDVSSGPALATETLARTEFAPDPTPERHAPPLFRLFKTENTHNEACVSVSDLVRGPVRWAVVSNFKIDLDFMQNHAPELLAIPRVHWLHGQDDLPNWIRANCPNKTDTGEWTTLKPATPQWGTHHSKFFLLVFPAGCRVVVHTANLCYGDLSAMSNAAWWQDFPKKTPESSAAHETSEFEEDLVRYLNRLGWRGRDEGTLFGHVGPEAFRAFDFAGAGAKLIASVPGRHGGANPRARREATAWGHPALRRALAKMAFPRRFRASPIVGQFSSIGSFSEKWLVSEFGASLRAGRAEPDPAADEACAAREPEDAASGPAERAARSSSLLGAGPIQLVWPTAAEVRASLLGYASGGSIPGNARNLAKPHVAARLHAWRALAEEARGAETTGAGRRSACPEGSGSDPHPYGRARAVPHIKTFARYAATDAGPPRLAWVFLGSHNLSGAAWGVFEKNETQLRVLSYELGVLLAPALVGPKRPPTTKTPFCAVAASLSASSDVGSVSSERFLCLAGARPRRAGGTGDGAGGASGDGAPTGAGSRGVEFRHARSVREWSRTKNEDEADAKETDETDETDDDVADFVFVPLPYPVPPRRYRPADAPWTIDTVHAEPDRFGRAWPPRGL